MRFIAMRHEQSAGILLFYLDNNDPIFLLLKYPTYWGFSKGIIEENESVEQTAKRELQEETGISNFEIIPGFTYIQDWFFRFNGELISKRATYFLAKTSKENSKTVKLSNEHEAFEWLSFEDATKKMKVKNNKEMLTKANEFIKSNGRQKKLF